MSSPMLDESSPLHCAAVVAQEPVAPPGVEDHGALMVLSPIGLIVWMPKEKASLDLASAEGLATFLKGH